MRVNSIDERLKRAENPLLAANGKADSRQTDGQHHPCIIVVYVAMRRGEMGMLHARRRLDEHVSRDRRAVRRRRCEHDNRAKQV